MAALSRDTVVGVVGAGTMGCGIAQVAAAAGHPVLLYDGVDGVAARARDKVGETLHRLVAKGRMTEAERGELLGRITPAARIEALAPAGLVIEAIVEDLEIKREVFGWLAGACAEDAILASNTSSLSITAIAKPLPAPGRVVGMHFFNPAPLMELVEVVSGLETDPDVARTVFDTAAAWGKSPVMAKSTPGFIVNRVARPYYGEALRLFEEGAADPTTLDAIAREAGGFRMGPFELMDLIGIDVNLAVTRSVWEAFFRDPRYAPSLVQQDLVDAGRLGRKSGRGFHRYDAAAAPSYPADLPRGPRPEHVLVSGDLGPAEPLVDLIAAAGIPVERDDGDPETSGTLLVGDTLLMLTPGALATEVAEELDSRRHGYGLVLFDLALDYATAKRICVAPGRATSDQGLAEAAGLFQALGKQVSAVADLPGLVVARTVAMLANEAAEAVHRGVCDAEAVDLAMRKGVNYPRGPLEWADAIGPDYLLAVLDNLATTYGEDRYRASVLLRRLVAAGETFHDI